MDWQEFWKQYLVYLDGHAGYPFPNVYNYPNKKSWVTEDIKAIFNNKKGFFVTCKNHKVHIVQWKIKIKKVNDKYRRNLNTEYTEVLNTNGLLDTFQSGFR